MQPSLSLPFDPRREFRNAAPFRSFHFDICVAKSEAKVIELLDRFFTFSGSLSLSQTVTYLEETSVLPMISVEDYVESRGDEPVKTFTRIYPTSRENKAAMALFESVKARTQVFAGCGKHSIPLLSLLAMRAHFAALEFLLPLLNIKGLVDLNTTDCRNWTVLHHLVALPLFADHSLDDISLSLYPHKVTQALKGAGAFGYSKTTRGATDTDLFQLTHPLQVKQIGRDGWTVAGLVMTRQQVYQDWNTPFNIVENPSFTRAQVLKLVQAYELHTLNKEPPYVTLTSKPGLGICGIANCDIPAGVIFVEYGGKLLLPHATIDMSELDQAPTHQMASGSLDPSGKEYVIDSFHIGSPGGFLTDGGPIASPTTLANYRGAPSRVFFTSLQHIPKGTVITHDYGCGQNAKDMHIETQMDMLIEFCKAISKNISQTIKDSIRVITRGFDSSEETEAYRLFVVIKYLFNTPTTLIDLVHDKAISIHHIQALYLIYKAQLSTISQEIAFNTIDGLTKIQRTQPEIWDQFLNTLQEIKTKHKKRSFIATLIASIAANIQAPSMAPEHFFILVNRLVRQIEDEFVKLNKQDKK